MDKLIELREVTAGYGNKIALRNVTLDVWKNDFLGIIGPNGGGSPVTVDDVIFSMYASGTALCRQRAKSGLN